MSFYFIAYFYLFPLSSFILTHWLPAPHSSFSGRDNITPALGPVGVQSTAGMGGFGMGQVSGAVGVGGTLGQHSSTPPSSLNGFGQQSLGNTSNTGMKFVVYASSIKLI